MQVLGPDLTDGSGASAFGGGGGWTLHTSSTSVGSGTTCDIAIPSGQNEVLILLSNVSHNNGSSQTLRALMRQRTGGTDSGNAVVSSSLSAASAWSGYIRAVKPDSTPVALEFNLQSGGAASPPNHFLGTAAPVSGIVHLTGGLSNIRIYPTAGNFDSGTYEVWKR